MRKNDKTFLFHIGLPKTGTTSIQGALVANAKRLREVGVYFPHDEDLYNGKFPLRNGISGAPQTDGFSYFVNEANPRRVSDFDWPQAVKNFQDSENDKYFVYSHESLSMGGARIKTEVFRPLAEIGNVEFLAYLRHPLSFLNSFSLQQIMGNAPASTRKDQNCTKTYLANGFVGLLEPYNALGKVHVRNFDVARQNGQLIEDAFSVFGAEDVLRSAEPAKTLNTSRPRQSMAPLVLALKAVAEWRIQDWVAIRSQISKAVEALEPKTELALLPKTLTDQVIERWSKDRLEIAEKYGLEMPETIPFKTGPETLMFTRDFADGLREKVSAKLNVNQRAWLEKALALADRDIEEYIEQSGNIHKPQKVTESTQRNPKMSDGKEKTKVNAEDASALARAIFMSQKSKDDETNFKDVRIDAIKQARRVIRLLDAKGFKLVKTES